MTDVPTCERCGGILVKRTVPPLAGARRCVNWPCALADARAEGAKVEREACAAICDAVVTQFIDECKSYQTSMGWTGQEAARRIRARSKERP